MSLDHEMASALNASAAGNAPPTTPAINMSGNLPPRVPDIFDPVLADAVQTALRDRSPSTLVGTHAFRGAERDREAGARFVARRYGEAPSADRVVITNGTQSAIVMLMSGLVGAGEVMAIEALSYPTIKTFAAMLGVRLRPVEVDDEGLKPDSFETACRVSKPKALYTMPTLQNPTTAIMGPARRHAIIAIARRHGVAIIEDDVYSILPRDAPPPLSAMAPDIGWYILGTAKCMAPGLKVAYLVAPTAADAQTHFWPGVRATFWNTSPLSAAIVTALIEGRGADRIIDGVRAETSARKAMLIGQMQRAELCAPEGSLHVWARLPDAISRHRLVAKAAEMGVEIGTSDTFQLADGPAVNAIRFGVGTPLTRQAFETGLAALMSAYSAAN
jgi:DNA-binding transcriptional MocR family regulator